MQPLRSAPLQSGLPDAPPARAGQTRPVGAARDSEFNNALSQSALYEVVNGRLQTGRHTIISTNLSAAEIGERHGPQLASRIAGLHWEITFYGDDLRLARL